MFTGIIKYLGKINSIRQKEDLSTIEVQLPKEAIENLQIGASVAINGTCLTVTKIEDNQIFFDLIQETLDKTNLKMLKIDCFVNVERSARLGDEIGGHLLSGHISCEAEIIQIEKLQNNHVLTLQVPPDWAKYLFPKGYIALNGASLTLVKVEPNGCFTVHLIPETLRATTFQTQTKGDRVNVEFDTQTQVIVDTITRQLKTHLM